MRRFVPTMLVAVMLYLLGGASQVSGQGSCQFEQGFAELRALIGEQTVGACLENEHVNPDNGNTEQRTLGGLMVWRKADNFTAFTDGSTTWVNGPNGLESRPNGERLAWERDPVAQPAGPTPKPLPTLPPRGHLVEGPAAATVTTTPSPATAGTGATPGTGTPAASASPAAGTSSANAAALAASPTKTPSPTKTRSPTKTPTPKPVVTAKWSERPDEAETGNDVYFEVETNAKKGTCSLTIDFRNTSEAGVGAKEIDDDGRCEWKFTLAEDTNTGRAKAVVTVSANGGTVTLEDTFQVKKGETIYTGSVDLEVEPTDLPNKVEPGEQIKIGVETNLKRKGSCELVMTWPKVGAASGESKMPDNSGRCSWTITVPAELPGDSEANVLITVRKNGSTVRTLTRDFKVR